MGRFLPYVVVGALIGAIAVAPLAAMAEDGLTLLVFAGPEGRTAGESLDIHAESYMWGQAVDLETLSGSVGFYGGPALTFMNVSTGKYHATYTIAASDVANGSLTVAVNGDLGLPSAFEYEIYPFAPGGGVPGGSGWDVKVRIVNYVEVGSSPAPGSTVTIEARSYRSGQLADGGAINATVAWYDAGPLFGGGPPTTENLTGTKVSAGVYRFTLATPANLTESRLYSLTVKLGTDLFGPSDFTGFSVGPIPAIVYLTNQTNTSAVVTVWAGGSSPIADADVEVTGMVTPYLPSYSVQPVGPVTGKTNSQGQAKLNVSWSGQGFVTIVANLTSGGKKASFTLLELGEATPAAWTAEPNLPFGCSAKLQSDPTEVGAGEAATLKFRVTQDGTALAARSVARYVWRDGALGTTLAGNVTTDSDGNFTLTYTVPQDWRSVDNLRILVLCPNGMSDEDSVSFGGDVGPFGPTNLDVSVGSGGRIGGALPVTVTYKGTEPTTDAYGYIVLFPANVSISWPPGPAGNHTLWALSGSGTTFTGSVTVPAWFPEGEYTVFVYLTNKAATSNLDDSFEEGGVAAVHISAAGTTDGTTGGGGKGFLPGFEAVSVAAAAGNVVGASLIGRRRRAA